MKLVKLVTQGKSQVLYIPKEYQFTDVNEVHIVREGDCIIIRPAKKTWLSLSKVSSSDFALERVDIVEDLCR